jgi:hypothetical protein
MDPRLALTVASAAAGLFALCRMLYTGASRSYPWFAIYLGAAALQSCVWLAGKPSSHRYLIAWAVSMPVLIGLRVIIVVELWRKLMVSYRGIESITRPFVWLIIGLALAVSAASGFDGLHFFGVSWRRVGFYCLSLALRYSGSALCVICSCLSLSTLVLPRNVSSNDIRHSILLTAYFATIAAGFLIMNYAPGSAPLAGALLTGSATGLYVLWGLLLSGPVKRARVPITRMVTRRTGLLADL